MGEVTAYDRQQWQGGIPKATYYDRHGRTYILPADAYSIEHYMGRGLTFSPPEAPAPISEPIGVIETRKRSGATTERGNELNVPQAPPRKKRAKKGKK